MPSATIDCTGGHSTSSGRRGVGLRLCFAARGLVPADVVDVRQRRALMDFDGDAAGGAPLVGELPARARRARENISKCAEPMSLCATMRSRAVGVAIDVADHRRRLGPRVRVHEAARAGDRRGEQAVRMRGGRRCARSFRDRRAVSDDSPSANRSRSETAVTSSELVAEPWRPDPVQRRHAALAPQVHRERAAAQRDRLRRRR